MKINKTTLVVLALVLGSVLSIEGASGQKRSGKKKPAQTSNSSAVTGKMRARRVSAKPAGESAPSTSIQPPISDIPDSTNENSAKPSIAKTTAGEKAGEPNATNGSKAPTDNSDEKRDEAKSLLSATDTKETSTSSDRLTPLREQIDAASSGSERIRLQLKLSEQLLAAGKKPEATQELLAIVNADTFYPQGYYNAGNALARLGHSAEAINAYRKAIEQRKGNYSRALNNLGVILLREGRWDEAYDALLSALNLESFRYAEASYNLGRLYSARGEREMATREWRRTLSIDPEHRAAAQALSLVASEPRIDVARPEASNKATNIKKHVSRGPESDMGNVVTPPRPAKSRSSGAVAPAKVLVIDPVSYDILQSARNLRERGKLDKAVENYQRVISRTNGYFAPANLELSYALLMLNKVDEALANLLLIANRDSAQYPIAHYHLARLYEQKGNLALAEESFAKAAAAYKSNNHSFLLDLTRVRERRGNFRGALEAFEEYLTGMEQQGGKPAWADVRLAALRRRAAAESK